MQARGEAGRKIRGRRRVGAGEVTVAGMLLGSCSLQPPVSALVPANPCNPRSSPARKVLSLPKGT